MECEPLFADADGLDPFSSRHLGGGSPHDRSDSPQASADSFMFSASARDGSDFLQYLQRGSPVGGAGAASEEASREEPYFGAGAWGPTSSAHSQEQVRIFKQAYRYMYNIKCGVQAGIKNDEN